MKFTASANTSLNYRQVNILYSTVLLRKKLFTQSKTVSVNIGSIYLIENFCTGIPRTLQSYEGYEVKPEFKASENFFIVTLPNVNYIQNESINDPGLEILQLIKENPGINAPSITSLLSVKDSSVTLFRVKNEIGRNLERYIEHVGSNKTGGYYLRKNE